MEKIVGSCVICTRNMRAASVSSIPCGHTFHYQCIRRWIRRSKQCPACRAHTVQTDICKRLYFADPNLSADGSVLEEAPDYASSEPDENDFTADEIGLHLTDDSLEGNHEIPRQIVGDALSRVADVVSQLPFSASAISHLDGSTDSEDSDDSESYSESLSTRSVSSEEETQSAYSEDEIYGLQDDFDDLANDGSLYELSLQGDPIDAAPEDADILALPSDTSGRESDFPFDNSADDNFADDHHFNAPSSLWDPDQYADYYDFNIGVYDSEENEANIDHNDDGYDFYVHNENEEDFDDDDDGDDDDGNDGYEGDEYFDDEEDIFDEDEVYDDDDEYTIDSTGSEDDDFYDSEIDEEHSSHCPICRTPIRQQQILSRLFFVPPNETERSVIVEIYQEPGDEATTEKNDISLESGMESLIQSHGDDGGSSSTDEEAEAHNRLIELNLRLEARAVERKAQLCQRGFLPDPCNIQVERQWDHRMHNGDSAVLGNNGRYDEVPLSLNQSAENGLNLTFINNATSNADHGHPITAGPLPTVNHPSTDRPAHEFLCESQCGGNVVKTHDSVDESDIVSGNNNDSDDDDISENNDNIDDDDSMSVESEGSIDVVSSGDEGSMDVAINENKNNDVATYCEGDECYFYQEQHRSVVYDNEDESFGAEQMGDQSDH